MNQPYNLNGAGEGGRRVNFRGIEFDPDIPLLVGGLTAWADFAPGIQTGGGTATVGAGTLEGKWRLVGDSLEIVIRAVFGAGLAIGAGTLEFTIADTGYAPDGTKCIAGAVLPSSQAEYHDSGTPGNDITGSASVTGSVNIALAFDPAEAAVTATAPFAFASGDSIVLRATIPVVATL